MKLTYVSRQMAGIVECFWAFRTLIWPLPGVDKNVPLQITRNGKAFRTVRATVWLLPRVHPSVNHESTLLTECHLTVLALEWFLAGVAADVPDQHLGIVE